MDLEVPLLAAKALLLLLLFAFIYVVVRQGVGDLRSVPDDAPYRPGVEQNGQGRSQYYPELVVEDSDIMAPETSFQILNGSVSIGRSSASDIVLSGDDYASGRHARLTSHGGLLYVEDSGSTNGTFVNERRAVGATPLHAGDTMRIGSTMFRYVE